MANLTGILGSQNAQPGLIQLGAGPAASGGGVTKSHSVSVAASIGVDILQGPTKRMVETVTVSPTLRLTRDRAISAQDSGTVAGTVDAITSAARVTQFSVDIVYRKAPIVFLTQTVTVTPEFHKYGRQVPVTVTHTVHTAMSEGIGPTLHKTVVDQVHVGQVCFGRNNHVRIGVTTSIGVGVPSTGRDDQDRQSVHDTVHLSYLAKPGSNKILIPETDGVAVADKVYHYTNPTLISLADFVTVTSTVNGGTGQRFITVVDEGTVATTANPKRPSQSVIDRLKVARSVNGGPKVRNFGVNDQIHTFSGVGERSAVIHQAVSDRLVVSHVRYARTPRVPETVAHAIRTATTQIGTGPHRLTVDDSLSVSSIIVPSASKIRIALTDSVSASDHVRPNIYSFSVSDAVSLKYRLWTPNIDVFSRIRVRDAVTRVLTHDLTDAISVNAALGRQAIFNPKLVDPLPIADTTVRGTVWTRDIAQTLVIPETSFPMRIFLPDPITVPVAAGALVTNYTVLQSKSSAIVLPAPLLGDAEVNVDAVKIHRSMKGAAMVFRNSSLRRRLTLHFRLDAVKAFELRTFLQANLSNPITMQTHDGQKWIVVIPNAPTEIQYAGRGADANEFATWEVEMEGQKISG